MMEEKDTMTKTLAALLMFAVALTGAAAEADLITTLTFETGARTDCPAHVGMLLCGYAESGYHLTPLVGDPPGIGAWDPAT